MNSDDELTISAAISNIGPQGLLWQTGITSLILTWSVFPDPIIYPPMAELEFFEACKNILQYAAV